MGKTTSWKFRAKKKLVRIHTTKRGQGYKSKILREKLTVSIRSTKERHKDKTKIDHTKSNSMCRFCGERNETSYHKRMSQTEIKKDAKLGRTGWER